MLDLLPLMVCLVAMPYQAHGPNLYAVTLVALLHTAHLMVGDVPLPGYYVWGIVSTVGFLLALSLCSRITTLVWCLVVTDVAMASIDLVGFITYTYEVTVLHDTRIAVERAVISLQLAALLVKDDRHVNLATAVNHLAKLLRNTIPGITTVAKVFARSTHT